MKKEFYEIMVGAKSKYRSLKIMALHDMQEHQNEYPKNGHEWNRCQKVIDRLKGEVKR